MTEQIGSTSVRRTRSLGAMRMARHRQRRRIGATCVMLEVRWAEILELVRLGLLAPDDRRDPIAVRDALYRFLDRSL